MQMHSSTQQDLMCRQGKIKVTRPGFNDNQQDLAHGKLAGRKEMECFIWSTSQAKPAKVQICDNLSAPMRGYLASSRSTSGYVLKKIADIRHEFYTNSFHLPSQSSNLSWMDMHALLLPLDLLPCPPPSINDKYYSIIHLL